MAPNLGWASTSRRPVLGRYGFDMAGRDLTVRPGDTLARLGGDEFVMLCTCVDNTQAATTVASRVLHALNQPFTVYGRTIDLSASIGISVWVERSSGFRRGSVSARQPRRIFARLFAGRWLSKVVLDFSPNRLAEPEIVSGCHGLKP